MPESGTDKLAVLIQCKTEWHAEAIASALRGRGIAAQAEGGMAAGWQAEAPTNWRVMVFTSDVLPARLLLTELKAEVGSIDWDAVDVGEHVEGVPEPAGKISADPPEPRPSNGRSKGLVLTILIVAVGFLLMVALRLVRGW